MGHLVMADQVKDQLDLDKILFMPTAQPPHSSVEKKTISSAIRVKMLELATQDNSEFEIELYEVEAGGKNYTYNTMKALIDLYPAVDFYFIIGGDMINDLDRKSTRLNSSHVSSSYAVFCLKKKTT